MSDSTRLRELFEAARALPTGERLVWLRQQLGEPCAESDALFAEVSELLTFATQQDGPLDTPLLNVERLRAARAAASEEPVPERMGPYQVLRAVGRGSMGTVYEAVQENPRRRVALKVLRSGMASEAALRRFQMEADALGRLDHPYIASIHEAGNTDFGGGPRPYLAMEFVAGRPLTAAVRALSPNTRDRLQLLARIGEGVAHAHSRGVVHRDLKPDNVLVDDALQPRILDFGVARLLEPDVSLSAHATAQGILVGTLQYMSPEQAAGDAARIDTRSDVYALGVLGYELLTGRAPYDLQQLSLPDALRAIGEQDGPLAGAWNQELVGDGETILAMAMHKLPERRYQSAAEFVADIRRLLADEPIVARPASTADQLRRFARKNRALVLGASIGMFLLLAGLAAMAWGLSEARERNTTNLKLLKRERAALAEAQEARRSLQAALEDAEALTEYVTRMMLSVHSGNEGWDVRMSAVIDAAAERAESLQSSERVQARIQETLGLAYLALGRFPDAKRHLETALVGWRALLGPDASESRSVQLNLGEASRAAGDSQRALAVQSELLDAGLRLFGAEDVRSLDAELKLCMTLHSRGALDEAERRLKGIIERAGNDLGPEHAVAVKATSTLGRVLMTANRYQEARSLFEEALQLRAESEDEDPLDSLYVRRSLAGLDLLAGAHEQALSLTLELQQDFEQTFGPEHPETLQGLVEKALIYKSMGRYDESLLAYETAVSGMLRVVGPSHHRTLLTRRRHAALLVDMGRIDEAGDVIDEVIEASAQLSPPPSWLLSARRGRGYTMLRNGDLVGARREYEQTVALMREHLGDKHIELAHTLMDLSNVDMNERRMQSADRLLHEAEAIYREVLGENHPDRHAAQMNRAYCMLNSGRYAEAEPLLLETIQGLRTTLASDHPTILRCLLWLARAWTNQGRGEQALPLIEGALESLVPRMGASHELVVEARTGQISALLEVGRLAEARAVFDELSAAYGQLDPSQAEALSLAHQEATLLRLSGDFPAAEALLSSALERARASDFATGHLPWDLGFELARVAACDGRLEQATDALELAHEEARNRWGPDSWAAQKSASALAELCGLRGLSEEAEGWQGELGPDGRRARAFVDAGARAPAR